MTIQEIDCPLPAPELFARFSRRPGCFFLDSALPLGGLGRYSFIGSDPERTLEAIGDRIRICRRDRTVETESDPLEALREQLGPRRSDPADQLPFTGGAVGGISYDAGSALEGKSSPRPNDLGMPDLHFGFYDGCIAFDHATGRVYLAANPGSGASDSAVIDQLASRLDTALRTAPPAPSGQPASPTSLRSELRPEEFVRAVERIRALIAAGDVYQVNLTQRFDIPLSLSAAELYGRLRSGNPAPFSCYYDAGAWQVVGSSPERFLRLRDGRIETRPIKGTRPRGVTPEDDRRLRAELLASAKDRAELLMIVDLERNDLGRVCEYGSIRVEGLHRLEEHPTVFHLVGEVSGRIRQGCDLIDCLRATLPGGSITGAPKIRAMEIINEVESVRRGFYTGCFGYLGFDGSCDLNIAIRTVFVTPGRATYHVGSGIVWDSDPEEEYRENLDKGRALLAALTENDHVRS